MKVDLEKYDGASERLTENATYHNLDNLKDKDFTFTLIKPI